MLDFKQTLVILGPTASGKTEISIALAEEIGAEIISADALQVYRGMDIATAKPTPSARARVPHHLLDILDLTEAYSAARFRQLALELIAEIRQKEKIPLLVGGSAMYIKSLIDGLFAAPPADLAIRRLLREAGKKQGPSYLYRRLEEVDPEAAGRIHAHDLKRIIRALEVFELTGSPISAFQQQWKKGNGGAVKEDERPGPDQQKDFLVIGIRRERADLYARINARVEEMFAIGLVEETRGLLERGANANRVAWQALGYREVESFLRGECSRQEAKEKLKRNTRRLAKGQLTWWRRDRRIRWVEVAPEESPSASAAGIVRMMEEMANK